MTAPTHSTKGYYPPKHTVINDQSGPKRLAEYGSIEVDLCAGVLRVHNEVVPGGVAVVQLIPNCGPGQVLPPPLPPADIVIPGATPAVTIEHNAGMLPIIQVYVAAPPSGSLTLATSAQVIVTQDSVNAFTVQNLAGVPLTVIYRF